MGRSYYVYILQSTSRRVLYIGMTGDIEHRMFQHKTHAFEGFAAKYNCERLVFYERYGRVVDAIRREKQLKGWRRAKKERLIAQVNPHWRDLSKEWWKELQRVWARGDELRAAAAQGETKDPSTPSLRDSAQDDTRTPSLRDSAQDDTSMEAENKKPGRGGRAY